MNCILMTISIEDTAMDALGAKEAVAMALEPLGGAQVLQMDVRGPEQMEMAGVVPSRPAASAVGQAPSAGTAKAPAKKGWSSMVCCLNCGHYRQQGGRDELGAFYYGTCGRTHSPVYALRDRCAAWKGCW